jgi:hypothetical protein
MRTWPDRWHHTAMSWRRAWRRIPRFLNGAFAALLGPWSRRAERSVIALAQSGSPNEFVLSRIRAFDQRVRQVWPRLRILALAAAAASVLVVLARSALGLVLRH